MHNNDNIVSDNLPIYFVWFGSDVPPKYFGNLQRTAQTNKSRDIILVYNEKHLPQDNRKNIDSLESISIDDIKTRAELKRDTNTQNLWKIDAYDMGLDEQSKDIYQVLDYCLLPEHSEHMKKVIQYNNIKYYIASDIIRLPLVNIAGGIYFDMDTEITGEIGALKSKYGFNFNVQSGDGSTSVFCNFFVKPNRECPFFNSVISQYIVGIKDKILAQTVMSSVSPSSFMFKCLLPRHGCVIKDGHICYTNRSAYDLFLSTLPDYSSNLPSTVILDNERRDNWKVDYNSQEDLKKLGLDEQDYDISGKLENLSLEQPGGSQIDNFRLIK